MRISSLLTLSVAGLVCAQPASLAKRDTEIIYLADCPIDGANDGFGEVVVSFSRCIIPLHLAANARIVLLGFQRVSKPRISLHKRRV
jgi:hypothetical protein